VAVAVLLSVLGTSAAVVADLVVRVEGGPSRVNGLLRPCNDAVVGIDEQVSFVLRREGPASAPLTVAYQLSGSAQPGVHYVPLPGTVTFAPGATTAVVDVVPLRSPGGAIVDLTMTVEGSSATIRFVSQPVPEPIECGYSFTRDHWNRSQTVAVGQPLHRLTLEQLVPPAMLPATGRFRLIGGALPPGVALREDGSFEGTPLVPGTFVARIEACRPAPPGTCVTTDLTVTSTWALNGPGGGSANLLVERVLGFVRQLLANLGLG
jgi:hypothetical protein